MKKYALTLAFILSSMFFCVSNSAANPYVDAESAKTLQRIIDKDQKDEYERYKSTQSSHNSSSDDSGVIVLGLLMMGGISYGLYATLFKKP